MGGKHSKPARSKLHESRGKVKRGKNKDKEAAAVETYEVALNDENPEIAKDDRREKLQRNHSFLSRRSSGAFQRFLQKADSFTIRSTFTNHFKLTSSCHHIKMQFDESRHSADEHGTHYYPTKTFQSKDFLFERVLGKGGFGIVLQAKRKATGKRYALKIQPIETMVKTCLTSTREKDVTLLYMERTVLAICRGFPFIVNLEYAFLDDRYSVLALECVTGGTLANVITSSPKRQLPLEVCKIYTMEIALALQFMHSKGIIYRDLKPSNVLMDSVSGHLKLSDFGLAGSLVRATHKGEDDNMEGLDDADDIEDAYSPSGSERIGGIDAPKPHEPNSDETESTGCDSNESPELGEEDIDMIEIAANQFEEDLSSESSRLDEPEQSNQQGRPTVLEGEGRKVRWVRRRTLCGTAGYRPPEQVLQRYVRYDRRRGYDERADWFALGSTCYTMVAGKRPFASKAEVLKQSRENKLEKITQEDLKSGLLPQIADVPEHAAAMALDDAEFRSMMMKIRYSPRFENDEPLSDFIEKLLARNPHDRLTFKGIIDHKWMTNIPVEANELQKVVLPNSVMEIVRNAGEEFKAAASNADRASLAFQKKTQKNLSKSKNKGIPLIEPPLPTMTDYIDDLVEAETEGLPRNQAQQIEARWYAEPPPENVELFAHWNFVSNDAIKFEKEAVVKAQARAAAKQAMETQEAKKNAKLLHRKTTGLLSVKNQ